VSEAEHEEQSSPHVPPTLLDILIWNPITNALHMEMNIASWWGCLSVILFRYADAGCILHPISFSPFRDGCSKSDLSQKVVSNVSWLRPQIYTACLPGKSAFRIADERILTKVSALRCSRMFQFVRLSTQGTCIVECMGERRLSDKRSIDILNAYPGPWSRRPLARQIRGRFLLL